MTRRSCYRAKSAELSVQHRQGLAPERHGLARDADAVESAAELGGLRFACQRAGDNRLAAAPGVGGHRPEADEQRPDLGEEILPLPLAFIGGDREAKGDAEAAAIGC